MRTIVEEDKISRNPSSYSVLFRGRAASRYKSSKKSSFKDDDYHIISINAKGAKLPLLAKSINRYSLNKTTLDAHSDTNSKLN